MLLRGGALGILVVVLATGCGGDDTLSREQYISKLNAMCEDFSAREKEIGDPQTLEDLVEQGPRVLAAFEEAIVDEIHTLNAPEELAAEADRLADLADRQRDVLAGLVDAANEGDVAKVRELAAQNETVNKEAAAIARALGATSCAGEEPLH